MADKNLRTFNITKSRLATIYRNEYINVFDVYLIAMFEQISVEALCSFKKIMPTRSEVFDSKVRAMFKNGKSQADISLALKVNHEVVRQVLLGTYDKEKNNKPRFRCTKWNWEEIDNNSCKALQSLKHTLPVKAMNKAKIAEALNLKDKSMRNLPKLKKMIRQIKKIE